MSPANVPPPPPPPPGGNLPSYQVPPAGAFASHPQPVEHHPHGHPPAGGFPPAPAKVEKPWWKRKRFIIPIVALLLIVVAQLGSSGEEVEKPADVTATQDEKSAEEIAAEEEAERQAEEEAAAEAAREAEEREAREAAEAAAKAEEDRLAAEAAAAEAARIGTISQQNAYDKATSYLAMTSFSRSGLIDQLEFEGFPAEDSEFAIARLEAEGGVDWNAQAADKAKSYLEMTAFSRSSLIDQLLFEGFTPEQAEYGVSTTGL